MRIAISGTHSSGKSTLIANFLGQNSHYHSYQEPFHVLIDEQQDSCDFSMESMQQQLELSIHQLEEGVEYDDAIFDRCPIDFIAYMMHFADGDGFDLADSDISDYFEQVVEAVQTLDLIVFLPLGPECQIEYFEADSDMRGAVDQNFKRLYRDGIYDLLPNYNNPPIIELYGDQKTALNKLQQIALRAC